MDHEIKTWLYDIFQAIEEIDGYFVDTPRSYSFFLSDRKTKRAIERNIEIIGEAVNRIIRKDKEFYLENAQKKLMEWVRAGGKLIAIENALNLFANKEGFALKTFDTEDEKKAAEKAAQELTKQERLEPYSDSERLEIAAGVAGAIYQVDMDQTHPLGYGTGGKFYSL